MRLQETSLPQELNLSTPSLELGNTSIHSAYMLECTINATNETGAAKTPTINEFLSVLENISVVSDNVRYHYSQNGKDMALRNAMFSPHGVPSRVVDKTFSEVADDGLMSASFVLALEEGDIVGLMHDSVSLKGSFASNMAANCPVTGVSIKPTIYELIPSPTAAAAKAELIARYGEGYTGALEPKVYTQTQKCSANTEVTGFFNLPTGALLRGALMQWSVAPSQFGLIATVPSRSELMRLNWNTAVAKDERRFGVPMPSNCTYFDFNAELAMNGLGLDGRNFNRGDYQISARTSAETELRYVSYEMMYPSVSGGALNTGHNLF
jgi:hypothetical protein